MIPVYAPDAFERWLCVPSPLVRRRPHAGCAVTYRFGSPLPRGGSEQLACFEGVSVWACTCVLCARVAYTCVRCASAYTAPCRPKYPLSWLAEHPMDSWTHGLRSLSPLFFFHCVYTCAKQGNLHSVRLDSHTSTLHKQAPRLICSVH